MANTNKPRVSAQGLAVLRAFLTAHPQRLTGSNLMDIVGISSGTVYPLLARFKAAGWLKSEWEKRDHADLGRPRKCYYTLTKAGTGAAHEHLAFVWPHAPGEHQNPTTQKRICSALMAESMRVLRSAARSLMLLVSSPVFHEKPHVPLASPG